MDPWEMIVAAWQRCWINEDCILSITYAQGEVLVLTIPIEENDNG